MNAEMDISKNQWRSTGGNEARITQWQHPGGLPGNHQPHISSTHSPTNSAIATAKVSQAKGK